MSTTGLAALGIGSAVLSGLGFAPYVRAILRGHTRPERASWWIWLVLTLVALTAQIAAGATWSLLLTATYFVGDLVIALLSLRYGYGRFTAKDILSLVAAGCGVLLWKLTNDPLIALVGAIAVDFLGNCLTLEKSWRAPYTENLVTWILISIAAILGVLSVGSLNVTRLIFPLFILVINWVTALTIVYRRHWRKQRILAGQRAAR